MWNHPVAYAEKRSMALPRVKITPIARAVEDYQKTYEDKAAELLGRPPSQPLARPSFDQLQAFEQAAARERAILVEISSGLQEALAKHSIPLVEEHPSLVLAIRIVRWGVESSPADINTPPGTVTVTCTEDGRELFTSVFQQPRWGFAKQPHAIGVSLGKKTADKLLQLVKNG